MRIYKLYANAVGSTFATVSAQIITKGSIVMVDWTAHLTGNGAAASGMVWELSLASNLQAQVNDAQDTVSTHGVYLTFDTAAARQVASAVKSVAMNLPVLAGQRLWLNTQLIGAAILNSGCYINVHVK